MTHPQRPSRAALSTALVAATCAVAVGIALPAPRSLPALEVAGVSPLPGPVRPVFGAPEPVKLGAGAHVARWAPVLRAVDARAAPREDSAPVGHLAEATPEGTTNIALVLDAARDASGHLWARVRLPVLPNGATGWVPREALGGYGVVRTHLVVDRGRLTATLYRAGRRIFRARIGVGRAAWPTPAGEFYIRNKLRGFDSPAYGPLAFGTSARSDVLTDWPAGGFVGIHGTDRPDLLPGAVSHGCIRMRNHDIVALGRLMPVGTPLTIR